MKAAVRFRLHGEDVRAEPFHYTMSGLDDIYLLNGFTPHDTPYGKGISIHHADELHKEIAFYIIKERKVLGSKDFKFLRKNMRFTQNEIAECLSVSNQMVARYEKGTSDIPGPVDKLIRLLYAFTQLPEKERVKLVNKIKAILKGNKNVVKSDETYDRPAYFGSDESGSWSKAARCLEEA